MPDEPKEPNEPRQTPESRLNSPWPWLALVVLAIVIAVVTYLIAADDGSAGPREPRSAGAIGNGENADRTVRPALGEQPPGVPAVAGSGQADPRRIPGIA